MQCWEGRNQVARCPSSCRSWAGRGMGASAESSGVEFEAVLARQAITSLTLLRQSLAVVWLLTPSNYRGVCSLSPSGTSAGVQWSVLRPADRADGPPLSSKRPARASRRKLRPPGSQRPGGWLRLATGQAKLGTACSDRILGLSETQCPLARRSCTTPLFTVGVCLGDVAVPNSIHGRVF